MTSLPSRLTMPLSEPYLPHCRRCSGKTQFTTMSAPASKKPRSAAKPREAALTLIQLPVDVVQLCLAFLTPVDFIRWSCTAIRMGIYLRTAMAGTHVATTLATAMMKQVLDKHVTWDEAPRQFEWNYMTYHGRQFPGLHVVHDPNAPAELSPYATYLELKYMEYYIQSHTVVNRATGNAHPLSTRWTYAEVRFIQDRLQITRVLRELAGLLLLPCWVNNRACYSLTELDDADMDFGQVQALMDANWIVAPQRPYQRYAYEESLRTLVAKQAVPHNGINYEPYFVGAKLAR